MSSTLCKPFNQAFWTFMKRTTPASSAMLYQIPLAWITLGTASKSGIGIHTLNNQS